MRCSPASTPAWRYASTTRGTRSPMLCTVAATSGVPVFRAARISGYRPGPIAPSNSPTRSSANGSCTSVHCPGCRSAHRCTPFTRSRTPNGASASWNNTTTRRVPLIASSFQSRRLRGEGFLGRNPIPPPPPLKDLDIGLLRGGWLRGEEEVLFTVSPWRDAEQPSAGSRLPLPTSSLFLLLFLFHSNLATRHSAFSLPHSTFTLWPKPTAHRSGIAPHCRRAPRRPTGPVVPSPRHRPIERESSWQARSIVYHWSGGCQALVRGNCGQLPPVVHCRVR